MKERIQEILSKKGFCSRRKEAILLRIVLSEGRNRQIRRVAEALVHKVIDLKRVSIATLKLGSHKEGSWRELDISEWKNLLK